MSCSCREVPHARSGSERSRPRRAQEMGDTISVRASLICWSNSVRSKLTVEGDKFSSAPKSPDKRDNSTTFYEVLLQSQGAGCLHAASLSPRQPGGSARARRSADHARAFGKARRRPDRDDPGPDELSASRDVVRGATTLVSRPVRRQSPPASSLRRGDDSPARPLPAVGRQTPESGSRGPESRGVRPSAPRR